MDFIINSLMWTIMHRWPYQRGQNGPCHLATSTFLLSLEDTLLIKFITTCNGKSKLYSAF